MSKDELFDDLAVQTAAQTFEPGGPRLRTPVRDQIELRAVDLDRLIGAEHPARVIWDYVQSSTFGLWSNPCGRANILRGGPRSVHNCCWRCGFMRPAKASGVRGHSPGYATAMTPIAGCAAV